MVADPVEEEAGLPEKFRKIYRRILKETKTQHEDKFTEKANNWSWAVCAATIYEYYGARKGNKPVSKIVQECKFPPDKKEVWPNPTLAFQMLGITITEQKDYVTEGPYTDEIFNALNKQPPQPVITSVGYQENNDKTKHLYYSFMLITHCRRNREGHGHKVFFTIHDPVYPFAKGQGIDVTIKGEDVIIRSIDLIQRKDRASRTPTWYKTWYAAP
jgi:hypothetical protein